jgi:hypothetical protein
MASKLILTVQRIVANLIWEINKKHDASFVQFTGTHNEGFGFTMWCDKHGYDAVVDAIENIGLQIEYHGAWSQDNHNRSLDELYVFIPNNWQLPKEQ